MDTAIVRWRLPRFRPYGDRLCEVGCPPGNVSGYALGLEPFDSTPSRKSTSVAVGITSMPRSMGAPALIPIAVAVTPRMWR